MTNILKRTALAVSSLLACQGLVLLGADAPKMSVLILTGRNNHNWQETTPVLTSILEDSGRFAVTVTEKPEACTAADFAEHDVLLSNWNNFGSKAGVNDWPEAMRTAFVDYVRNGGGFVVVHAGGAMFTEWTEFQQIIGATWGKGTGHGPKHEFTVKRVGDHPITKGLTPFRTTDELWHRMAVTGEPTALATAFSDKEKRGSGQDEPLVRITQPGKGRCFNLTLGHDAAAMRPPGFKALLLRGTEWAATGKVTITASTLPGESDIDQMLAAIASYKFGDSRAALVDVEDLIYASAANGGLSAMLDIKLAGMLAGEATADARKFVCKQLSIVGTARAVPALAKLLADADLAIHARAALERIPDDAAAAAMRDALASASGKTRVGLINTLGKLGDAKAVSALTKLASDTDAQTAGAAIDALGTIAGADALAALSAMKGTPDTLCVRRAAAMLLCAEGLVRDGKSDAAGPVLAELIKPDQARHIRLAAFPVHVATLGEEGSDTVLAALAGNDPGLQRAAVRALRTVPSPELTKAVAAKLPDLPAALQEQLVALLGERGDPAVIPAIERAAASDQAGVKSAAIVALGNLGNAATVATLADLAEAADGVARSAVVTALARLRGDGVNEAIIGVAKSAPEPVQCELIKALPARDARATVPALAELAKTGGPGTRTEALKAIGQLGDLAATKPLIAMIAEADDADKPRIQAALVAICRREGTSAPVAEAIKASSGTQKASLLGALGTFGGDAAFAALADAAKEKDDDVRVAAVRALSGWVDATPIELLLATATASADLCTRVLALRGIADLAPKAQELPQDELADILGKAIAIADRAEEKRALLAALRAVRSSKALSSAFALLDDKQLASEACLAVVDIAEAVGPRNPDLANAALERVIARSPDPAVAARATGLVGMCALSDNLAIGGRATSPDGLEKDGAAGGDQAAIDGNPATYWDEKDGQKLYRLRVEMIDEAKVTAIRILGYQQHSYSPKDFDILCDDRVVKSVANAQYKDSAILIPLPPTTCRTVELSITGYYTQSPAIRELEIFGETKEPVTPKPKPDGIADGLYETDRSLACARDGRTLWRLNFDRKEGKPYMHPLRLPNGDVLTALRPADHVWHRALWFSWKYINGLNYWEENKKTGLSDGRTTLRSSKIATDDDGSATAEMELDYHPPDGPAVLSEKRRIAVTAPDADGSYRIDWTATFTAGDADVKLDRTPLPGEPGGAGHGGYAGFSARLGRNVRKGVFLTSEGATGQKNTHGKTARWMDYSGEDGGIAILDHPENPRHPAPWYVAERMPYFSPAFLFRESMTLAPAQELTLRYRVVVHDKSVDADRLNNEWKQFAEE